MSVTIVVPGTTSEMVFHQQRRNYFGALVFQTVVARAAVGAASLQYDRASSNDE
jgi:hypothetical protein